MSLPTRGTDGLADSYLADSSRLIGALRVLNAPRHIVEQATGELHSLWREWNYLEHSLGWNERETDKQQLAHDAAKLTQRLARLWCNLEKRA